MEQLLEDYLLQMNDNDAEMRRDGAEATEMESRLVSAGEEIQINALTRRPSIGDNSSGSNRSAPQKWGFTDAIHGWNEFIKRGLSHRRYELEREL